MDDLQFGKRNKRGDWAPNDALTIAPFYSFPPNPVKILKWLIGYLLPWNVMFMASAYAFSTWLLPDIDTMKTLQWGWILQLLAINAIAIFLFYGAFELPLYIRRAQGNHFKYNAKFPGDAKSDVFWFGSQSIDSILRCFVTGVPIWTAYQVGIFYAFANGYMPWLTFADNFWYLLALGFLVPIWHEFHFFCIHRLIHTPFLYKWVHSVHHNSVNPSPWSSLSMHPVEQLLYFSSSLLYLIIPSNPVMALYQLHFAGFGAVVGHIGFDKIEVGSEGGFDTHAYSHYLHHKYFEVNYGDGSVPLDKLFGTFHDGTAEGEAIMEARFRKLRERANRTA
jgi:sterol desaturase/sphingolipid hydroxylase (fatty acid hydroxylase superfamily)